MVNVTIVSRKDTISNWQTSNPVLSDGEVAVVEIPATDSTPAICLIKIGDGTTPFNTLQYMQSPAADVYAWAKASTKPEYDYSEIKNLTTMIVAGNNITATTKDNKVTIATPQNVAKIPGTLPDIGDIEALPVWSSDEGWKRIDMDALKATANTIVKRNASGQIVTAAPTANTHATNKKYVDDAVSGKQDALTAGNGIDITDNTIKVDDSHIPYLATAPISSRVLYYKSSTNSWDTMNYSTGADADSIAKRGSDGTLKVATPTLDEHATTKKYVDDKVASKQDTLTAGDGIDITDNTIKVDNHVAYLTTLASGSVLPVWTGSRWGQLTYSYNAAGNTVARRNPTGTVEVATPTADSHAATKAYVDNKATAGNIKWDTVTSSTSGSVTPIGMAMSDFHSANRLSFSKAAGITIESSTDGGTTWVDSAVPDSEKIKLVSGLEGYSPTIGLVYPTDYSNAGRIATANDMLRITLDGSKMGVYTLARKLLINVSTVGAAGCKVLVERARNSAPTDFQTVIEAPISGWSGWNDIAFGGSTFTFGSTQSANWGIIRLTFSITGVNSETYPGFLRIINLALFGDAYWTTPSSYAKSGHLYTWDYDQNVTFPKQVRTNSVPTAENDLTNKKYVDGLIAGKQSKLTAGSGIDVTDNNISVDDTVATVGDLSATFGDYVPVKSNQGAGVRWDKVQVLATADKENTIVKRTSTGQAIVADPTADAHAATKAYVDNKMGSPTCPDGMLSLQAGKTETGTSSQGGAVTLTTSVTGKRVTITYSDGLSSLGDSSYISTAIGTITLTSGQSFVIPATTARTGGKEPWGDNYYGLEVYAIKGSTTYKGDFVIEEAQDAGGVGHYSAKKLTEAGTYTLYVRAAALATDSSYGAPFHSSAIDLTGASGLYAFVTASGEGISMQLDDDGEHNVISLDDKIARVAVLKNNVIPAYVNSKWGSYNVSYTSEASSIVQRTYLGRIQAAAPGADNDVTTKKYVDDAIKNAITTALNTSV